MAREGWALSSAGASGRIQSEVLEEKGVGSGQGDLSKDYTPYLNNKECPETHGHLLASSDGLVSPMSVGKNKRQPQRSKHSVIFECQCCSGWIIYSGAGPDQQHSKCVFETAVQSWRMALLQYLFCLLVRVFSFSFDNYTNNLWFWQSFVNINLKFSFHTAWWLSYICLYYESIHLKIYWLIYFIVLLGFRFAC